MSLKHFKSFDDQLTALLVSLPQPDSSQPGSAARQHYFTALAEHWSTGTAHNRQTQLVEILHGQLLAQIALRTDDHTLGSNHAALLEVCVHNPLPWQRQELESDQRPQIYRPLLDIGSPNWRAYLPGAFVIVEGGPEGRMPDPRQPSDHALLVTLSHGIEAFDDLGALHTELCERLDDPQQSRVTLRYMSTDQEKDNARNAERLRYEWFSEDLLQAQAQVLIEGQRTRLTQIWAEATLNTPIDWPTLAQNLKTSADLLPWAGSQPALLTRYGLLLERNSPAWLRNASAQGLTHIMQTMQELVVAIDSAGASGILNHEQFLQENGLRNWTCAQLRAAMLHQHQFDADPLELYVSVTMARQRGPVLHPGLSSGYIPVASRPQVGDTVELVRKTYRFDQLAMLNVSLLDVDYWLTARVHRQDGSAVPQITPVQVKQMVRALDVGESYSQYLRTHLLDSPAAQWRKERHVQVSKARMLAEAAKARYAGHYLDDPFERGYTRTRAVLDQPDSEQRQTGDDRRLTVRQWLIDGHTIQCVLLITYDIAGSDRLLVYTPDAPDRRAWREYRNARHLLRTLREKPALRDYVKDRAPLADRQLIENYFTKGGLGSRVATPEINGDFLQARYEAEVQAALAEVDASTNTKLELLGEISLHTLWVLLDLLSLVLPNRTLTALSFGRTLISVLDTGKAYNEDDRVGMLKHLVEAFTHVNDGLNSIGGSTVVRRAIRAMPPTPPLTLPPVLRVRPDISRLHYRVDGIHKEGIYEQPSPHPGRSLYFIKDNEGESYQVAFDGYRWRVVDPRKPDAYTQVPVKRRADGQWVVDSPVLWYDGLPDLQALFDGCRLAQAPSGVAQEDDGVYLSDQGLHLLAGVHALPLRAHLLEHHYHLRLSAASQAGAGVWAILRWQDGQWRIRVRQAGRSSDWLALPQAYSVSLGRR
ncbi:TPA: DUF6543 domain-containing protein [Pseudomonas putida]